MHDDERGPLRGVKVLELGSFIAGPFAGQLLADYGAEVVKVEDPVHGDPMRRWGLVHEDESLWWPAIARNKRSLAVDLRDERCRELVRRLAGQCDVIVENFRPGRLEEWNLGYDELVELNPALVMVRVSGYGQSGPLSEQAGFGSIAEAFGGIRHTTGFPDRPPTRTGVSLGDALASLFAVVGALAALHHARVTGKGQVVDVAIYEAVAALMESTLADYEVAGTLRGRSGSVLPGVAPSNAYPTADRANILIAANADSVFKRLCDAMDRPELADDERFRTHSERGANMELLDVIIAGWTETLSAEDLLQRLRKHSVPAGPIMTAREMLENEHWRAREMVQRLVNRAGIEVPMVGIVPRFLGTPGRIANGGPELGSDTYHILKEDLGLSDDAIVALARSERIRLAEAGDTTPNGG